MRRRDLVVGGLLRRVAGGLLGGLGLLLLVAAVITSGVIPIYASVDHPEPFASILDFAKKRSFATYSLGVEEPDRLEEDDALVMRGAGPVGYPGGAEVVNMRPSAALIAAGVDALPCIGDGRQSGTSGSPSILNASPEAAIGGGLALVRTGDIIRIDLAARRVDVLLDEQEIERRRAEVDGAAAELAPQSQTPWQEIQRDLVGQFDGGAVLENAVKYQRIAQTKGLPRDSH